LVSPKEDKTEVDYLRGRNSGSIEVSSLRIVIQKRNYKTTHPSSLKTLPALSNSSLARKMKSVSLLKKKEEKRGKKHHQKHTTESASEFVVKCSARPIFQAPTSQTY